MYKQGGIKKSILFIIAIAILSVGYSQNTNSANGEKSTEVVAFEKPSKKVLKKAKKSLDKGLKSKFTEPKLAEKFYAATQVDALAISVGNTHLEQEKATEVDTKLVSQIEKFVKCPLVIHGGSGIKTTQLHWLAKNTAICKINIGTQLRQVFGENLREYLLNNPTIFDRIEILSHVYEKIIPTTKKIILNLRPDK